MNLAPEKLMPALGSIIEQERVSTDPSHRAAAFMAMAVVAEGCADHIMTKYEQFSFALSSDARLLYLIY